MIECFGDVPCTVGSPCVDALYGRRGAGRSGAGRESTSRPGEASRPCTPARPAPRGDLQRASITAEYSGDPKHTGHLRDARQTMLTSTCRVHTAPHASETLKVLETAHARSAARLRRRMHARLAPGPGRQSAERAAARRRGARRAPSRRRAGARGEAAGAGARGSLPTRRRPRRWCAWRGAFGTADRFGDRRYLK